MSSAVEGVSTKRENHTSNWALWLRQVGAIFRLEVEKNFLGRRALLIYLIALLPLFPLLVLAVVRPPGNEWKDFNRICMDLHEPVSRRPGRPEFALLFSECGAKRGAGRR